MNVEYDQSNNEKNFANTWLMSLAMIDRKWIEELTFNVNYEMDEYRVPKCELADPPVERGPK